MPVKKNAPKGKKRVASPKPAPRKVIPIHKKSATQPDAEDSDMDIYWAEDDEVSGKGKKTGS
ncbi:MAG TPA: hypothetical protein VNZ86_04890 [Bacteroidia bacterium]|jgi:hypothetical protein|nr:hypothetical protein [Bacteroidia bacterium]